MDEFKRILVVSRSTKYCQKAVHYGISLGRKYGARLYVLHVMNNPFGLKGLSMLIPSLKALEREYEAMQREARLELDKIIKLEQGQGLPIDVSVTDGDPKEEILRVVAEKTIDLLIMLAHEEWRFEHFLFCRDVEALIRKMPCSIMFVRQELTPMPEDDE
jgi:nucleotide-binding universal stress UspA family protein